MKQPDKLFRDKLHSYARPVSADVWQRIADNKNIRHRKYIWLKVAASLLLLAASSFLILPYLSADRPTATAEDNSGRTGTESTTNDQPVGPERPVPPKKEEELSRSPLADTKPQEKRERKLPKTNTAAPQAIVEDYDAFREPVIAQVEEPEPEPTDSDVAETINEAPVAQSKQEAKNVTIVFTADEVNAKYLTKRIASGATPDEEETSTLRKVLDKAYDLKHNQNPLGDLRQKKNEILALNFKGDKQRNQN